MNITVITVGSLKEKFWKDACAEYAKRLSAYCRLTVTEVKDEKTPEGCPPAMEEKIREKAAVVLGQPVRVILKEPGTGGADLLSSLARQFGNMDNITIK